jgi:hypothetical protein
MEVLFIAMKASQLLLSECSQFFWIYIDNIFKSNCKAAEENKLAMRTGPSQSFVFNCELFSVDKSLRKIFFYTGREGEILF